MKRKRYDTNEARIFDAIVGGIGRLFGGKKPASKPGVVSGTLDRDYVREEWQRITQSMQMMGESRFQTAVISADKLLDYVLRAMAPGETMGDRLINAKGHFTNRDDYQAAWNGHKLRNRLVHETNYQTVSWEAQQAIKDFERALKNLGVI